MRQLGSRLHINEDFLFIWNKSQFFYIFNWANVQEFQRFVDQEIGIQTGNKMASSLMRLG